MTGTKTHYRAGAGPCAVLTREPLCGGGLTVKVWAVGEPSLVTCGQCRARRSFKALDAPAPAEEPKEKR